MDTALGQLTLGCGPSPDRGQFLFVVMSTMPTEYGAMPGPPVLEFRLAREEVQPFADAINDYLHGLVIPFPNGNGKH